MDKLKIEGLRVSYGRGKEILEVLKDINLSVKEREIFGIAGESGSGKSTLAKAIIGLMPRDGVITAGKILYEETDLIILKERQFRKLRGKEVVFMPGGQGDALNPTRKIKKQFKDVGGRKEMTDDKILRILKKLRIREPNEVMEKYPFQLSGGMKQRVLLGMALVHRPKLLIIDEPTSAIDRHLREAMILELKTVQREYGLTMIVISHHLEELYELCNRVGIMYQGELVEVGETKTIFERPQHDYTKLLLGRRGVRHE